MRELIITVERDGKTSVEVQGVQGKQCLGLTQDIEKALGGKVLSRQPTTEMDEFEAKANITQTNKLGG
jgi:hypothetical protein